MSSSATGSSTAYASLDGQPSSVGQASKGGLNGVIHSIRPFSAPVRTRGSPLIFDTRAARPAASAQQPARPPSFFERWSRRGIVNTRVAGEDGTAEPTTPAEEDTGMAGQREHAPRPASPAPPVQQPFVSPPPSSSHASPSPPSSINVQTPQVDSTVEFDAILRPHSKALLVVQAYGNSAGRTGVKKWQDAMLELGDAIEQAGAELSTRLWTHIAMKATTPPEVLLEELLTLKQGSPLPNRPVPSSKTPKPLSSTRLTSSPPAALVTPNAEAQAAPEQDQSTSSANKQSTPSPTPQATTSEAADRTTGQASNWPFIGPIEPSKNPPPLVRRMNGGLRATFLSHSTPNYLSSIDPERQRSKIAKLLKINSEKMRNFHFTLPKNDVDGAASLVSRAPALPLDYSRSSAAIQPLPTHLNFLIATGQKPTLSHYCYETGIYADTKEDAKAAVVHVMKFIREHGGPGEIRLSELWYRGITRFEDLGGWEGVLKSICRYLGRSNGFNRPSANGNVYIRLEDHFVGTEAAACNLSFHSLLLQSTHTSPVPLKIYAAFVSDASSLPSDLTEGDVAQIEALLSIARRTDFLLGGGNLLSCGNVLFDVAIPRLLRLLTPTATLAEVESSSVVPSSVFSSLIRAHAPSTSLNTIINLKDRAVMSRDEGKEDDTDSTEPRREARPSLTNSPFVKGPPSQAKEIWKQLGNGDDDGTRGESEGGSRGDESDEREGDESKQETTTRPGATNRKIQLIRSAIAQLSSEEQHALLSFVHSTFIDSLLQTVSGGSLVPIITAETIRAGIDITLTRTAPAYRTDDPDEVRRYNARNHQISLILAHGRKSLRCRVRVSLDQHVAEARMRWSDTRKVLEVKNRNGEGMKVLVKAGPASVLDDWMWTKDEVLQKVKAKVGKTHGPVRALMKGILDG